MKNKKFIITIVFFMYFVALMVVLFGNSIYVRDIEKYELVNHVNLTPFKEIKRYITAITAHTIPWENIIANLLGNILLFVPMEAYLMYMFRRMRKCYVVLPFMALVIWYVEIMQYFTKRGSCDIDDFILNFAGCILAYLVTMIFLKVKKKG